MIDFIKVRPHGISQEDLLNNPSLDFSTDVYINTGEIKRDRLFAEFEGLKITIKKGTYLELSGSLHRYWNRSTIAESVNYNDFKIPDIKGTVDLLCRKLRINPNDAPLHNIEFGVNLEVPFNSSHFIKKCIIDYKGDPGSIGKFNGTGYLRRFEMSNYYIKIYDKGLHQNQSNNILRLEIGTKKMEHIRDSGIKTLIDICDATKLKILGMKLQNAFGKLLMCDHINAPATLNKEERRIFSSGINPKYWENTLPDPKSYKYGSKDKGYKSDRKRYDKERSRFRLLIAKYNLNESQLLVTDLISKKCEELLKEEKQPGGKLTNFTYERREEINHLNILSVSPLKETSISTSEYSYKLECVSKVLDGYYGGLFTDHEIMSEYTIELLWEECKEEYGIELNIEEFIDYAKQLEPVLSTCPF